MSQRFPVRSFSLGATQRIPGPTTGAAATLEDFMQRIQKTDLLQALSSYYYEYGPIVSLEIFGERHIYLYEPEHMMQVHRLEGPIPRTGVTEHWPKAKYWKNRGFHDPWASSQEDWKKSRRVMQKDILPPMAAESYLPLMDAPARGASAVVDRVPFDKLGPYASADMFFSIMFGVNANSCGALVGGKADPLDLKFIETAVSAMGNMFQLMVFGDKKEVWDRFNSEHDFIIERTRFYLDRFNTTAVTSSFPVDPYFLRLDRGKELTESELLAGAGTLLFAGVDTTANLTMWNVVNLAFNPTVQQKLYEELKTVVGDGPLEASHLKQLPYLNSVLRESHRLTPALNLGYRRQLSSTAEIGGYSIPADVKICMHIHTVQNDPKLVPNWKAFSPERWSPKEIEKRKGTHQEIIDHPLLNEPFGFGARKCMGFRASKAEVKVLLSRLIRDWKISVEPGSQFVLGNVVLTQPNPFPKLIWEKRK